MNYCESHFTLPYYHKIIYGTTGRDSDESIVDDDDDGMSGWSGGRKGKPLNADARAVW